MHYTHLEVLDFFSMFWFNKAEGATYVPAGVLKLSGAYGRGLEGEVDKRVIYA